MRRGLGRHNYRSATVSAGAANDPNWSSVKLLLNTTSTNGQQNNTFLDSSTNAFTITRNGDTTQGTFSPFSLTAGQSWSASVNGGSGYFNGSTDYLTYAPSTTLAFGTGNFTVECWHYATVAASGGSGMYLLDARTSIVTNAWAFGYRFNGIGTGNLVGWYNGATVLEGSAAPLNQWNHVVYVRSGTTGSLFLNGVRIATQTDSTNYSSTGATATVGSRYSVVDLVFGYMSNFRVVKGTAVYDPTQTTLTVPTAPLTAITNTSLLLNSTNAGIYDASTVNDVQTLGSSQVSTTQAKFGTTSMSFNGTTDYLMTIDKSGLQFGTSDFTIEGWVYLNAINVAYGIISKGAAATGWSLNITSGNKLQFSYTASNLTGATSLAAGTWYYVAVTRSGSGVGNLKIFINGSADATSAGAVTDTFNQTNSMYVGANRVAGSLLNGYIDELRVTNGVARTITTPTAAFPTN